MKRLFHRARRKSLVRVPHHRSGQLLAGMLFLALRWGLAEAPAVSPEQIAQEVRSRPEISNPKSIPDKKQRIALLIRDLADVDAQPIMMNCYISFRHEPATLL